MNRLNKREGGLFLLAVIARLFFLWVLIIKAGEKLLDVVLKGDAFGYYNLALNLRYLFTLIIPETTFFSDYFLRSPGYPIFLATILYTFAKSPFAIIIFQAIFSGLSAVLIYRIARLMNLPGLVGMGSALFFSVEPIMVITSNSILSETLFLFLLLLFIYFLFRSVQKNDFRKKNFLILGLLLGFNILVRPILYPLLLLFALFLVYLVYKRFTVVQTGLRMLIFLAGAYIFIFPWLLRNKLVFDSWSISSISGVHLYYSYAVPFYAYQHDIINKDLAEKELDQKIKPQLVGNRYDLRNNNTYKKFGREIILSDPLKYGFFHLANTTSFFMSNGYRNIPRELGFTVKSPPLNYSFIRLLLTGKISGLLEFFKNNKFQFAAFIIGNLTWLLINLFLIVGVIKGFLFEPDKAKKTFITLFILLIGYFAITAGPEAYYKMRFPVNPFIFILAFYGLERFLSRFPAYANR